MTQQTFFVIRHRNGQIMPVLRRPGYTQLSLDKWHGVPRLFPSKQSAKVALGWWLKGRWVSVGKTPLHGECAAAYQVDPDASRRIEDYYIQEVRLEFGTKH